ncbi:tripartite tricarboxylate transporter TctB family protein [Natrinema versiforme]|uniref:Tripartite tricarboxylate transporter TctB family protein n=1 Tax=Natrinema versiforme TaxID=88724 RepID=A0A4P8WP30_9EURY|nr:tripartite tricarboxylate transporter TctB family protein [Natrinema versiforme]QCS44972.1 tripartite tricarboxylate transporter TctB family protein [Natrinema versiforme]
MNIKQNPITKNPIAVGFILLSLFVINTAQGFPDRGQVGAGFFPIFLSVSIIVFSIAVIIRDEEMEPGFDIDRSGLKSVLLVFGLLVTYLVALPVLGFLVASILFLFAISYYSGLTSKPLLIPFAVGSPLVLYYIFDVIFLIRLPKGIIPISNLLPNIPLVI